MNGMGSAKDVIIMLALIIGIISMTAFVSSLKIGERMDRSIAAMNTKGRHKDDPQTMKHTLIGIAVIAAGVSLILILKQFDVITDTFFPYIKSQ